MDLVFAAPLLKTGGKQGFSTLPPVLLKMNITVARNALKCIVLN
jgi:hypothetical protein